MSQKGNSGDWVRDYPENRYYLGRVRWFKHMQYPRERKWPIVSEIVCERGKYLYVEKQRRLIGPDMPTRRHPLGRFAVTIQSAEDLEEAILDPRWIEMVYFPRGVHVTKLVIFLTALHARSADRTS